MQNNFNIYQLNIAYFIIDNLKKIMAFDDFKSNDIALALLVFPQIGQTVMEIIPQKRIYYIQEIINEYQSGKKIIKEVLKKRKIQTKRLIILRLNNLLNRSGNIATLEINGSEFIKLNLSGTRRTYTSEKVRG